jgi:hypothetical protein
VMTQDYQERCVYFSSAALATDPAGQADVLGEDRDALGVDRAQVRVLEHAHEAGLRRLLQREDWNRRSLLKSIAISRTRRWKGTLCSRSSVDFW